VEKSLPYTGWHLCIPHIWEMVAQSGI